jgi:hypothetical protein
MLYKHRTSGEVRTVDGWMRKYGWTEEIQFDQGSDDLIAVDESEVTNEEAFAAKAADAVHELLQPNQNALPSPDVCKQNATGLRSPRFGGDKQHPVVGSL